MIIATNASQEETTRVNKKTIESVLIEKLQRLQDRNDEKEKEKLMKPKQQETSSSLA